MKFTIEVDEGEKYVVEFSRNWFFGNVSIKVNGLKVVGNNVLDPSVHFSLRLVRKYAILLGDNMKYSLLIEKQRPLLLAGLRPQTYRAYVNNKLVLMKIGY